MIDTNKIFKKFVSDGDKEAIGTLYARYYRELYLFLYRFVENKEETENVIQDTFLQILKMQEKEKLNGVENFPSWLYRVAFNRWLKSLQTKNRRRGIENSEIIPFLKESVELNSRIDYDTIMKVMDLLKNPTHKLILDYSAKGLDNQAIAKKLGETGKDIRRKKYEARKAFKELLKRLGVIERPPKLHNSLLAIVRCLLVDLRNHR